jgi:hypothetical protein
MTITQFIERCDQYCRRAGVTRVWLSKRLLADTYRLDHLAAGKVDIGVKRLARAAADLAALDADRASREVAA